MLRLLSVSFWHTNRHAILDIVGATFAATNDETILGVPDRVLAIDQDPFGSGAEDAAHRFLIFFPRVRI